MEWYITHKLPTGKVIKVPVDDCMPFYVNCDICGKPIEMGLSDFVELFDDIISAKHKECSDKENIKAKFEVIKGNKK